MDRDEQIIQAEFKLLKKKFPSVKEFTIIHGIGIRKGCKLVFTSNILLGKFTEDETYGQLEVKFHTVNANDSSWFEKDENAPKSRFQFGSQSDINNKPKNSPW